MGGKSGPAAPDYRGAAEEQGQSSIAAIEAQTKANRPNQYTPFGSSEWQQDAGGNWRQDINLSQGQQGALDDQMAITGGRSAIAKGMLGRANQEMDTPQDFWNTLPDAAGGANVPDFYGQGLPQMGQFPDPNAGPQVPSDAPQYGDLSQFGQTPEAQGRAGSQYNPDFAKTQFDRQMSLAQPQMERQTQQLETQLRNQGLSPGTPAYDNAISDMRNQQGEQTSRMQQDAMRLGADEQQRSFGRELQGGAQQFGQQAQQQQAANQMRGQQFGEMREMQNMYGGQADAAFQRQLQASQYQNQQRQQAGQEQLAFGAQGFNQQMAQSGFQNQVRQQAIAEQMQKEGWSLNKINAMLSGQQVGMPSMPNFQSAGAAQPTQYLNAANMQGQFDQASAANQQAQSGGMMSALGTIGGGMFGGPMGAALGSKMGGMMGGG